MKGLFVTGTDTDIGKTLVSSILCSAFSRFKPTTYMKPIQAGTPTDFDQVLKLTGSSIAIKSPAYMLETPASPDRAATKEGVEIQMDRLLENIQDSSEKFKIVEGAGGLLVPINKKEMIIDLAKNSQLPVVLVTSTRLGTINHTLLSIEALKKRNIPCKGLILNGEVDHGLKELLIEKSGLPVLCEIPVFKNVNRETLNAFVENSEDLAGFVDSCFVEEDVEFKRDLFSKDKEFVWHPFTQHGIVKNHPVVTQGRGSHLFLDNYKVLDAISSWWVNLFGHSHPELCAAIKEQSEKLEHVIFAGFSHEPAIELSEKLIQTAQKSGANLKKVFFSDNGSTSVEVALKMAWQFQRIKKNNTKKRFLAFRGSYHGDTLGAMSVGERKGFNEVFNPLLFDVDFIDPFNASELDKIIQAESNEYAAVIVEPMVQGASGMRMYGSEVLDKISQWTKSNDTLVICDEVFTGFYRTGKMFAFEHSELRPDLLCLSKGLTGGFLPLAVTLATDELFQTFESDDMREAFLHGHSYTANPIACAVASKSLEILQRNETQQKISDIEKWTAKALQRISQNSDLFRVRQLGTIGAMEINDEDPNYFKGDFSYRFNQAALKEGLLLRPLGGTVYSVPPYCIEEDEIDFIYNSIPKIMNKEFK